MENKLIKYIKQLCNESPFDFLKNSSNWFSNSFVTSNDKTFYPYYDTQYNSFFFEKNISSFQKDVGLKFLINKDINDTSKDLEKISEWIIKDWGGIRGISNPTIKEIVKKINDKNYHFDNISSWSKIHSFKNINTDIIYDSKVIYSINWLILKLNIEDYKFFLQPLGRNRKLSTFPIDSIINYIHSDELNMDKKGEKITESVYYKKTEVYTKYRDLIHLINQNLWGDIELDLSKLIGEKIPLKDYPFFTEMLLFNMSDRVIFEDIRKSIEINIK